MEKRKWYAIEYAGFWNIQEDDKYGGRNVLDAAIVGEEQAEENAKLCASAPEMKELLDDMYKWFSDVYGYEEVSRTGELMSRYEKIMENDNKNCVE